MTDNVNHPSHYAEGWSNGAEVIDITENLNFNRGNAVKYIARAGVKDPESLLEDLRKAQWYLDREIDRLEDAQTEDMELEIDRLLRLEALRDSWGAGEFEWDIEDVPADDQFFIEHMEAPLQPRVWESLTDVPLDLPVIGRDGGEDPWYGEGPDGSTDFDRYGPFTEVIGNE